jgi:hypothetical protein
MGGGAEGGPGLPSGEQDKQSVCSRKVTRRPWGSQEDIQTGSMRHQDLIMHRVCNVVYKSSLFSLNDCNCNQCLILIICFRRINHMVVKNNLHSSSDLHKSCVGHSNYKNLHMLYLAL